MATMRCCRFCPSFIQMPCQITIVYLDSPQSMPTCSLRSPRNNDTVVPSTAQSLARGKRCFRNIMSIHHVEALQDDDHQREKKRRRAIEETSMQTLGGLFVWDTRDWKRGNSRKANKGRGGTEEA